MGEKCALVTGAGKGIGRAIAIALAEAGYNIGINYNSSGAKAEEVCEIARSKNVDAVAIKADISRLSEINRMFELFNGKFGRLDLLVNNAGVSMFRPFVEVTEEFWEKVVYTDFKGAFFCTQTAAKIMISKNIKGSIINISSNQIYGCWPNATVYAAAKGALSTATKNIAMELARYGIRVNTIAPGYTDVKWEYIEGLDDVSEMYKVADKIPLKRFAEPEEIANTVVFLASDKASYFTGTCLQQDGGSLLPVLTENNI